jgi:arginyl-tRNA synthetase
VYPEVVECASRELSPHALAQFLLKLAEAFNSFYHALQVLNAESKGLAEARLALVEAVSSVLKNALGLLGIETVEKM